jgi:hypothetical protein
LATPVSAPRPYGWRWPEAWRGSCRSFAAIGLFLLRYITGSRRCYLTSPLSLGSFDRTDVPQATPCSFKVEVQSKSQALH